MRKSGLAALAALLTLSMMPIEVLAQSITIERARRPTGSVYREREVVREPARRRVVVEEDEEECRIIKRRRWDPDRRRYVTRTVRIGDC
jgi:hypothetical protein